MVLRDSDDPDKFFETKVSTPAKLNMAANSSEFSNLIAEPELEIRQESESEEEMIEADIEMTRASRYHSQLPENAHRNFGEADR